MGDIVIWNNLPDEILVVIVSKLSFCEDYIKLSAVSKSWKSVMSELREDEKPLLPPKSPLLILAEQVPEGAIISCEFGIEDEDWDVDEVGDVEELDSEEEEEEQEDHYLKNSVGSIRDLYNLSTGKTYTIELPEASGKLILGTNKGWLVTVGRDLQINLLHPLLRKQIPLPSADTFPIQYREFSPEEKFDLFIDKVAMSSKLSTTKNAVFDNHTYSPHPIIMTIYGECKFLGFARPGDKVWTNVSIPSRSFDDIAYYKGKFYAVDCHGDVFVCDIDDDYNRGGRAKGTKIASFPLEYHYDDDQRYLVESGSSLWLILRIRKVGYFKPPHHERIKYYTTDFSVWKLEMKYSDDSLETPSSCTRIQESNLGDKALFIGKGSSVSLPSSAYIKPNCIYFTDDNTELYYRRGGGHDMGIFNMDSHTIEPFYQGKSIHPISPPLWYI